MTSKQRSLDLRRPDLKGVRRTGTIRWWKPDKGYGRVTADDGEVLSAIFSDLDALGGLPPKQGERVSFIWEGGKQDHGRHRAEHIIRLRD